MAEYDMQDQVHDFHVADAKLAREVADDFSPNGRTKSLEAHAIVSAVPLARIWKTRPSCLLFCILIKPSGCISRRGSC